LKIDDVRPSCDCTTPDWDPAPIAPGGSARIDAAIDTTRLAGPQQQLIEIDIGAFDLHTALATYRLTVQGTVTADGED